MHEWSSQELVEEGGKKRVSDSPLAVVNEVAHRIFASSHDRQPRKMQFICWRLRKLNEATRVEWNYGNQRCCCFFLLYLRDISATTCFVCINISCGGTQHRRRRKKRRAAERKRQELGRWNWHFHTQHLALLELGRTEAEWYSFYWKSSSKWEMHDSIWKRRLARFHAARWMTTKMHEYKGRQYFWIFTTLYGAPWWTRSRAHCVMWLCERITMPKRGGLSPRKRNDLRINWNRTPARNYKNWLFFSFLLEILNLYLGCSNWIIFHFRLFCLSDVSRETFDFLGVIHLFDREFSLLCDFSSPSINQSAR